MSGNHRSSSETQPKYQCLKFISNKCSNTIKYLIYLHYNSNVIFYSTLLSFVNVALNLIENNLSYKQPHEVFFNYVLRKILLRENTIISLILAQMITIVFQISHNHPLHVQIILFILFNGITYIIFFKNLLLSSYLPT